MHSEPTYVYKRYKQHSYRDKGGILEEMEYKRQEIREDIAENLVTLV